MLSVALTGAGPLLWEPTYGLQVYPSTYWQWGCLGRVSATDQIWNQTHNPSGVEKQWSHCCSLFTLSVHSTRVSSLILSMCSFSGSHWATTSIRWTNTLTRVCFTLVSLSALVKIISVQPTRTTHWDERGYASPEITFPRQAPSHRAAEYSGRTSVQERGHVWHGYSCMLYSSLLLTL